MSDTREDLPAEPKKSEPKTGRRLFTGKKDPRNGRGPKKGAPNAGRPKKAYVEWCRDAIRDPKVEQAVMETISDKKHQHFAAMYRTLAERAHGKPVQPLSAPDGGALIPKDIRVTLVKPDDSASA